MNYTKHEICPNFEIILSMESILLCLILSLSRSLNFSSTEPFFVHCVCICTQYSICLQIPYNFGSLVNFSHVVPCWGFPAESDWAKCTGSLAIIPPLHTQKTGSWNSTINQPHKNWLCVCRFDGKLWVSCSKTENYFLFYYTNMPYDCSVRFDRNRLRVSEQTSNESEIIG